MRRYQPMRASRGTTWPLAVSRAIRERDGGCVGPRVGMDGPCSGSLEIDHVRASGAIGKKSPSVVENGAVLCGSHHRLKTEYGKTWRPRILDYIAGKTA